MYTYLLISSKAVFRLSLTLKLRLRLSIKPGQIYSEVNDISRDLRRKLQCTFQTICFFFSSYLSFSFKTCNLILHLILSTDPNNFKAMSFAIAFYSERLIFGKRTSHISPKKYFTSKTGTKRR